MRKLKFFLIGLVPGLLIVFFILNQKGVSCSGYLPNSRVIAETLSKDFTFSPEFQSAMNQNNLDEKFLRDSLITYGEIDFKRSQAQLEPCPQYLLSYPDKNPRYEITYEKCEEGANFKTIRKIR